MPIQYLYSFQKFLNTASAKKKTSCNKITESHEGHNMNPLYCWQTSLNCKVRQSFDNHSTQSARGFD